MVVRITQHRLEWRVRTDWWQRRLSNSRLEGTAQVSCCVNLVAYTFPTCVAVAQVGDTESWGGGEGEREKHGGNVTVYGALSRSAPGRLYRYLKVACRFDGVRKIQRFD